jgi:hypothetical protein
MALINPSIIITTEQNQHREWMAFACWYSLHKHLPECKIAAVFPRSKNSHHFIWMNKCNVPYLVYSSENTTKDAIENLISHNAIEENVLVVSDHIMLVKKFDLDVKGIVEVESLIAKSDTESTFVDFSEVGKFKIEEWTSKEKRHPFFRTGALSLKGKNINEHRVFQLWRQMGDAFDFINRI